MIKGFYSGSYEIPIPFSNWDNFDKILDLIDDYIELKEQIEERSKIWQEFLQTHFMGNMKINILM